MKMVKFVFDPKAVTLTGQISADLIATIYADDLFRYNVDFRTANGELVDDSGSNDSEDVTRSLKAYGAEFSLDSNEAITAYVSATKVPERKEPEYRKEAFTFMIGKNYMCSVGPKDGKFEVVVSALFAAGSVTVATLKKAPTEETARIIANDYLTAR